MGNLVFIQKGRVVTDSLTVADVFSKSHKNVYRDIEHQLQKLNEAGESNWGQLNFEHTHYEHPQNKQRYKKFDLTEDAFALIAMSYVTADAMKMKVKFLSEFKRMQTELQKVNQPSYMITDPVERAKAWIKEQEEKQQLELRAAKFEEKADYVDQILKSSGTMLVTQIAADYGLSAVALNKILKEEGVQRKVGKQWVLYNKHMNKGYTKSHTHIDDGGNSRPNTHWTQQGRLFIHEIMKSRGIEALEDRKKATAGTEAS